MKKDDFEKYKIIAELIPGKIDGLAEAGISTAELAGEIGVPEGSVKSWRLGAIPTESSLAKLDRVVASSANAKSDFGIQATVPQTIAALSIAGFSHEAIAEASGVKTTNTVSNWLHEKRKPQTESRNRLESLRIAMNMIIESGLEPDTAAIWLQSPLSDKHENIPMNELANDPKVVFEAIDVLFVQPYGK